MRRDRRYREAPEPDYPAVLVEVHPRPIAQLGGRFIRVPACTGGDGSYLGRPPRQHGPVGGQYEVELLGRKRGHRLRDCVSEAVNGGLAGHWVPPRRSLAQPLLAGPVGMISCLPDMYSTVLAPASAAAAARFFRVLGDPTRLQILELLQDGERSVGHLVAAVGQPQPRVSTHLACLRHCGFVTTERRGKEVIYQLALSGLDQIVGSAAEGMGPLAERLAPCTRG